MKWFDKHGWLHVDPQPSDCENAPLFTAEYKFLTITQLRLSRDTNEGLWWFVSEEGLIETIIDKKGNFHNRPESEKYPWSDDDHFSHDNLTGIVSLSYLLGLSYHKSANRFMFSQRHLHPRDIVFYEFCHGGVRGFIARFFLWIPIICMIVSCFQRYKVRNGVKMVKTDGKLLTWVRCVSTQHNSIQMKLCFKICTWILKRHKKVNIDDWGKVFSQYFKHPEHPNRVLAEEIYK